MAVNRRKCLKLLACAGGGAAVGVGGARLVCAAGNRTVPEWKCFSAEEVPVLEALCEQIIPTDEFPGARETGAVTYIDRVLRLKRYVKLQAVYHEGLALLRQKNFVALPFAEQTELLKSLERSDGAFRHFFNAVIDHTMQSYYGSPRHGGNKDYASYKMMGLDYPRLIGR